MSMFVCARCDSSVREHHAHGLCKRCYGRTARRATRGLARFKVQELLDELEAREAEAAQDMTNYWPFHMARLRRKFVARQMVAA